MTTDALSEVLRAVRLTGAVFFKLEGSGSWVAEALPAQQVAPRVLPGAEHVIEYHVVTRGSCWAAIVGEPAIQLHAGDVVVFTQGDAHVMSSAPGMRTPPNPEHYRRPANGQLPVSVSFNGPAPALRGGAAFNGPAPALRGGAAFNGPAPALRGGAAFEELAPECTRLVCGFIGYDAFPFNPLLATLPRVLHVPRRAGEQGALIEQLVQVAVLETEQQRPASETMLARLSELLFIEAVRHHIAVLPGDTTGWLAGLRDQLVGRCLAVLHDRPAHDWSLEELAKETGLSRSVLAERFHHYVGVPPMQYLARWRMQLAASLLANTNLGLAEIAQRVGYGSEAALSRAFKRLVGLAPSAWREGQRRAIAPDASFASTERAGDGLDGGDTLDPLP